MIFTVTAGRTGTRFLSILFGLFRKVASYHEPFPSFIHFSHENKTFDDFRTFLRTEKLPSIENLVEGREIYMEMSHGFCKYFFYPLLDLGYVPDLLLIKRNRRKIAKSFLSLDLIPGTTERGNIFAISPSHPENVTRLGDWKRRTPYELCYWYTLEIEHRMRKYKREVERGGGKAIYISANMIKDKGNFNRIANFLELGDPEKIKLRDHRFICGRIYNHKNRIKAPLPLLDYRKLEERVIKNTWMK